MNSVIDEETLMILDDLFGNPQYLSELLPPFRTQIAVVQVSLEQAISKLDPKAVIFHAHSLKSSSAQLGALRVSGCCQLIETLGHRAEWKDIDLALGNLKAEAARAVLELSELEVLRRAG
jgi:HPt (histidine-containing phosphotransfer) domain-containing protein